MRILLITPDYPKPEQGSNILTDLADCLKQHQHTTDVIVYEEKKNTNATTHNVENGINVLRVRVGNIYKVGFIEKTMTYLSSGNEIIKAMKLYLSKNKYDLILAYSQPVTVNKVISWAKRKYKCNSFLMMKDIFPQNGVDLGLYSKLNPVYWYFRYEEKKLYNASDIIGCMSAGNMKYLEVHNRQLDNNRFVLFPNTVKINEYVKPSTFERESIRNSFGYSNNDVLAIYGGNFGRPQGLDFLVTIINAYRNNNKVKFILIGKGTEKDKVCSSIKSTNSKNVTILDYIPRIEYEKLLSVCDIGLIFLDKRFTIPNYPSKTLSYMACGLPIMAAIDSTTDYGDLLEENRLGFKTINGDLEDYQYKFNKLLTDKNLRETLGKNGRNYYEKEFNVENSVRILEQLDI